MKKDIYEINFERLKKLGIIHDGKSAENQRLSSGGFMDIVVEKTYEDLPNNSEGYVLSLAHYYEQNGDLCSDPEMTIAIYPELKRVEALSFQQAMPPVYQVVYPEPGKFAPRLKRDLNNFLKTWLNNLIKQGHKSNTVKAA